MTAPLSDRERLARELCRYIWNSPKEWGRLRYSEKRIFYREAGRILKMVCGSCGLAIPLMGKGKKK